MNWDEEIQNLVRDIQMEAVIIELCRLAVDKQSRHNFSEVLARSSSCLEQRSRDRFVWSQEFVSRMETDTVTGKKRAKNWLQNSGG